MAISLGSIVVDLIAKTGNFVDGMSKASHEAKSAAKSIQANFAELGNAAQSLLAPFGEIGSALGQSLGSIGNTMKSVTSSLSPLISELGLAGAGMASVAGAAVALGAAGAGIAFFASKAGDELFQLSQNSGVSAETLSSLSYASIQSGVNIQDLALGLQRLSRRAFEAATAPAGAVNAFTRLGIAVKDSNGQLRPTTAVLEDIAAKFEKMPDGISKTALAQQLLGRTGAQMITFLNSGKESIAGLVQEANEFGVTMSGKTAAAANTFNDTLDRIEGALKGASNVMLSALLPSMQAFADFFVNDLKDPSGVFRTLGSVIGTILVPSFKLLASVIVTAVTAADYFSAALGSGIKFASQLVFGLINAFEDLKSGHFREAGQELKAQFQQGLSDFTKGVESETDKANKRLTDFFAKTVFGADDQSSLQKKQNLEDFSVNPAKQIRDNEDVRVRNVFRQIKPVKAPDLSQTLQDFQGVTEALQKLQNVGGVTNDILAMGKDDLDSFYSEFQRRNSDTIDAVNAKFDEMAAHFSGMLGLNAISQADFNQVSKDLETARLAEIQRLRVKSGTDFVASFADAFNQIIVNGDQMAAHLADAMTTAVKGMSDQLSTLLVTGRANFSEIGKSFEKQVLQAGTDKLFASATKSIGSMFGVHFNGKKPTGTNTDPIWTKSADAKVADVAHGIGDKKLGDIGEKISGDLSKAFKGLGSALGKIGGGFLGALGGLFHFRADGGDVSPGQAYIVGERQPEMFIPRAAGRIAPSVSPAAFASAAQRPIQVNAHFHGVTDADSFKASKSQILSHLANTTSRAVSRR